MYLCGLIFVYLDILSYIAHGCDVCESIAASISGTDVEQEGYLEINWSQQLDTFCQGVPLSLLAFLVSS